MSNLREPFNAVSHAAGALMSLTGLVGLELIAQGLLQSLVFLIYGLSLFLLYLVSALYHGLHLSVKGLSILRTLDRIAIAVLIAGTTTPIALLGLPDRIGWILLGLTWSGVLLIGVMHLFPNVPDWVYTLTYLLLGWLGIFLFNPILEALTLRSVLWMLAGGIFYTVGAVIYLFDWPHPIPERVNAHGLWHLLCISGSFTHFVGIVGLV